MFDPLNQQHLGRFTDAFRYSRQTLEGFREQFKEIAEAYTGNRYNGKGTPRAVKFLRQAAITYQRQLVPRSPRVLISTPYIALKDKAKAMKVWMDDRMEAMRLEDTLRRVVLDAFLKIGIVKVGLCIYDQIEFEGTTHDLGEPYVDPIDFDDFVIDMSVKRYDQAAFIGHKYRMPVDVARSSSFFDGPDKDKIQATTAKLHSETGDENLGGMTHEADWTEGEIEDMVDIWEIFFPREKLVVSFLADEGGGISTNVLRVAPWKGPKRGPYHLLGFIDVPGQILPGGTAEDMVDLDEQANNLFAKLCDQADRQKTVTGVPATSEDAKRIETAKDGAVVHLTGPGEPKEIRFGGADPNNLQFFQFVKMLTDFFGGNISAQAGLGPQAETLGQDQLIHAAASKTSEEMGYRTQRVTDDILQDLAFYWWNNPIETYNVERPIPNTRFTYQTKITPEDRAGNFIRLNFRLDSYSMLPQTPQQKDQMVTDIWRSDIVPLAGQMTQAGMTPNIEGYLKLKAQYRDFTDLDQLVQFSTPPEDQPHSQAPQSQPEKPPMPAATTRTNVRVNKPGMTTQGQNMGMMQMFQNMANNQQNGAA